ncbi:MAG: hypothetical protein QOD13_1050 [Thermoleophilaceae bacterium]|nr:hypothetical protein [Thermoleophilaceae bacterium]
MEAVLVFGTQGAPARHRRRDRRPRELSSAQAAEPVPTARATVVRAAAFSSGAEAAAWFAGLRADEEALDAEVGSAVVVLNRALRLRRAATADPYLAELSADRALVVRAGYGSGEAVAEGRFAEALELPRPGARRVKRSMEAPEERFAAMLGARQKPLVAEELVLRARADLNAERPREAALQARVALEALVAELGDGAEHREAVGGAANAALAGDLGDSELHALTEAVKAMEAALRRHRLGG